MIEEPDDYLIELLPDTTDHHNRKEQASGSSDEIIAARQGEKGLVIGKIGCWQGNEVGFMLHSDYWRKGYISEAFEGFLEYLRQVSCSSSSECQRQSMITRARLTEPLF